MKAILSLGVPGWRCWSSQWQPNQLCLFVVYLMLRGRSSFVVIVSCDVVKHYPCPMCTGISSQQYLLSMHRQHILLLCCQCCLQCFSENKRAFVSHVPHCAVTTSVLQGLFGVVPHTQACVWEGRLYHICLERLKVHEINPCRWHV